MTYRPTLTGTPSTPRWSTATKRRRSANPSREVSSSASPTLVKLAGYAQLSQRVKPKCLLPAPADLSPSLTTSARQILRILRRVTCPSPRKRTSQQLTASHLTTEIGSVIQRSLKRRHNSRSKSSARPGSQLMAIIRTIPQYTDLSRAKRTVSWGMSEMWTQTPALKNSSGSVSATSRLAGRCQAWFKD